MAMPPVRVKYYGLLPVTRRQYLTLQAALVVLCLILLTIWLALPMPDAFRQAPRTDVKARLIKVFWENFLWIVLIALSLEAIETLIMLQKFARKEAKQLAGSPGTDTTAGPNRAGRF
jgi:hypothetical protein